MISSMGLNPLEADAAIQETLKRTGFNMSYEKISDISKDVQDKIGQLSLGEWKTDKKTGQSTYSGGGEMSDWLQIMVNRGVYPTGSIKHSPKCERSSGTSNPLKIIAEKREINRL